jgi:hypothetical protein
LPDTTKLSKRRLIWSVCAFFFWQTPQCSSRNTTYSESNFQGLCDCVCWLLFSLFRKMWKKNMRDLWTTSYLWIVLKSKEEIRHSILDHIFDYLPKFELVSLTNLKTLNTAYYFVIFHLKSKTN